MNCVVIKADINVNVLTVSSMGVGVVGGESGLQ